MGLRKFFGMKPKLTGSNDLRPYDQCWDVALNLAMDRFPVEISAHTAKIGPFHVWTSNYPYCYGHRYEAGYPESGLPSLETRARLYEIVKDKSCTNYIAAIEKYAP